MRRVLGTLIVFVLAAPAGAGSEGKARKPRFDLRASPRVAFSPAYVLVTAELTGGEELEEFYCPELMWEWDDGAKSGHGQDCPPFQPGTELERRFTADHAYRRAGVYNVRVRLMRGGRAVAVASTTITIRPGLGDPSQ